MAVFHSGTSPNTFFYRRNTECLETVLQGHKRLAMFVSMSINKDPYVIWLVLSSFNSRNSNDFMSFKMGLNRWLVTHHNSRQQLENHKCVGVAMTMPHEGVSLHLFLFPGNNHHFCNMPCYFQLVASFSARFPLSWRYLSGLQGPQTPAAAVGGPGVCPKGQPVPQHVLAGGLEHDLT